MVIPFLMVIPLKEICPEWPTTWLICVENVIHLFT